jgi:hypothetical protein
MASSQVVDGGGSLWIRRLAANIWNKQSYTANRGVAFHLGGWAWDQQLLTIKIKLVTKC